MPSKPTRATTREPNGRPGRPSSLSEQTSKLFQQSILSLNTIEDAATIAGVDYSTVARWMKKGRSASRGEYRDFYEAVESAKARAKAVLVKKVVDHGRADPKMALKILERRYPKEWALLRRLEMEDKTPVSKREGIRDRVVAQLDQIAKRLEERAHRTPAPVVDED